MADFIDDGSVPLVGPRMSRVHQHGRRGLIIDAPMRGTSERTYLDDFDTLEDAVRRFGVEMIAWDEIIREQRVSRSAECNV